MKLFIDSIFSSAAWTYARISAEEIPCASGLLRGNGAAPLQIDPKRQPPRPDKDVSCSWSGMIGKDAEFRRSWIIADKAKPGNHAAEQESTDPTTNSPGRTR